MKAKVIVVLLIIILLLVVVYAAAFMLGAPRAKAPVSPEGEEPPVVDSGFRGPTGLPHVEGPSESPPGAP